jgi:hypothetical protein
MPKHSDQIALAAGFDTQHAEAVLGVVKGDKPYIGSPKSSD